MLSGLVKNKEKAFLFGRRKMELLKNEVNAQVLAYNSKNPDLKNLFIGLNVFDVTNIIYNNNNFYDYLKYSFIAKYYERKIVSIKLLVALLFVLVGVVLYFVLGFGIFFYISVIILVIGLLYLLLFVLKSGESYSSYYKSTMLDFLLGIYGNIYGKMGSFDMLDDDDISDIYYGGYDKKRVINNISFDGINSSGKIADLELMREIETTDRNGNTRKHYSKIFDGFCTVINAKKVGNLFRGNNIKITNDESLWSSITEDTVKGIYESSREYSFNSEEMNKAFDAKASGHTGFESVDDMLIQVRKVITPSFEQHLLYLKERYNTFNMKISDKGLVLLVDMKKTLYQKSKDKELFDLSVTYREANENFKMLKADLNGIDDFAYYRVFPFLERIYLINYLTYLYLSYMDFENYYNVNNSNINTYEEMMRNVFKMPNKEFREIHTERIKEIKNNVKDCLVEIEKEV